MFKLAMIQMRVDGGERVANLRRARERLDEAASRGAEVAVLPEALNLGWAHPSARRAAEPVPDGPTGECLRESARRHRLFLCAGLIERCGDMVFNSALLISPTGEVLLHHRKLNELELAHEFYAQGDRLAVAATPLATFGVMICADAFARGQVVSRALGLMGASVILSPCAWAVPADHDNLREPYGQLWRDNYGPVARDFRLWIAGVSNVGAISCGPWAGRKCIGCSLLVSPDGKEILQGPYGVDAETILFSDIDPQPRPARSDGWSKLAQFHPMV